MASAQSKMFNVILRLVNKKGLLKRQFGRSSFNSFTTPKPPQTILKTCEVQSGLFKGTAVFTLSSKKRSSKKHILYLHGGAYVTSFVKLHWYFMEDMVANTQCTITAPDYPLAPKHNYKEAFSVMLALYKELLIRNRPEDLIIIGDSAGGGMALALAQMLSYENIPQPNQIILLSPWLDLTLSNPDIKALDSADPFTGIDGLLLAGEAYAGGDDPEHYLLSPINGPLEELGKISIFVGTKEILVADARKLRNMMQARGIDINYYEYKDMTHVWMLLHFPESRKARNEIAELINS